MGPVSARNTALLTGAQKIPGKCVHVNSGRNTESQAEATGKQNGTKRPVPWEGGRVRKAPHVLVSERLQQQEQDGLEVLLPDAQAVFPCDLEQLQQGALPLLHPLVVVGQLFQKVSHQVRVVDGHWRDTGTGRVTSRGLGRGRALRLLSALPEADPPPSPLPGPAPSLLPAFDTLSRPLHQI